MRTIERIGAGVVFVLLIGLSLLIYGAKSNSAQEYLERYGYQVQTFERQAFQTSCTMSKDRDLYNFTATRYGRTVRGYLCYGGFSKAKIHEENN